MSEENTAVADATAPETTAETPVEVKKEKKTRGPNIPSTVFVEVYNSSNDRDEVLAKFAEKGFKLTYGALISRASKYVEEGVHLKELARKRTTGKQGKKLNIEELNKLADEVLAANTITKVKRHRLKLPQPN
jgi:hypothetical protein